MAGPLSIYRELIVELVRDVPTPILQSKRHVDQLLNAYSRLVRGLTASSFRQILGQSVEWTGTPQAANAEFWSIAAWSSLCQQVALRTAERQPGITNLIRHHRGGAFLLVTPADNLEATTYHELQILHAIESCAVRSGDMTASDTARRAASWHVQETQPDHATSQPWGLNAMIRVPAARPLADMMLQAVQLASVESMDPVTLLLLRDCLYCIDRYEAEGLA